MSVEVRGLVLVGTRTPVASAMSAFARDVVDDLEQAAAELRAAGVVTGTVGEAGGQRYLHLRAPDGQLHELVQDL